MQTISGRRAAVRSALVGAILVSLGGVAQAAPFTAGNIVTYRVGDGVGTLVNTGNPVFLDEYTPAGTLVQSIALPTTASGAQKQLIASGTAGSEGLLSTSMDAQYLLLTGYATNLGGGTSLSSTTSAAVPRTVGRVKYDGTIDTSTALTDFSSANNPRGACSTNGTDMWVAGAGGTGGVRYATLGAATSTQLVALGGARQVLVSGGQLYATSNAAGNANVNSIGTGTPTTTGQTATRLAGLADVSSPDGFFFASLPGGTVLYVADDTAGGGQIQKYSLVSGSWTANGTITAATVRGLTGTVNGSTVTLYGTSNGSGGTAGVLYQFTDSTGYDANVSGTVTSLVTLPSNKAFRGIALAPQAPPTPTPTPADTATVTATAVDTATATATETGTALPTNTATATNTAVDTATAAATSTDTATATATATASATATGTATPTATATPGPFSAGNLVIYRVGDGVANLVNTGSAVFLDEYAPDGTLIQSVPLPTAASGANKQLIASGTATSEGQLTRSSDGQYLLLTGYGRDLGGSGSISSTTAAAVPRVVGRVRFDGTADTSTALGDFADANNPRSATSTDGTDLWVAGASGATGGVRYTTLGSTTSTQLSTDSTNVRQVLVFGGQLYMSTQNGTTIRIGAVGSGLPTTAGQSIVNLPGVPLTIVPNGYFFADLPGGTVLYVADDTTGGGQIQKYSLVSGTWTANGTIAAAMVRAVVGIVNGSTVDLYGTTSGAAGTTGTLYGFADTTGFNGSVSATATTLATAPAKEAFRGIALAPVEAPSPTPTDTPADTPTETATPLATATTTNTPVATATATNTTVPPATATATHSAAPTATATATAADSPTPTATAGASAACPATPASGCLLSGKSLFSIGANASPAKNKLGFKWLKGAAVANADIDDPTASADYTLCVYGNGALLFSATAPHGALWSAKGGTPPRKYLYKDAAAANDGLFKLQVAVGADGKAKAQVKGKGANLPAVSLPLAPADLPVTVQLRNGASGQCWTADYANAPAKNVASKLLLKLP
jgi:hypothetical protein